MKFRNYLYPKDYPNYNGRHVYYHASHDMGYRIKSTDESKYKILASRYLISIASVIMFSGLFSNRIAVILGFFVLVSLELYFRMKFIKDLQIEAKFNVVKENKPLEGDKRKKMILSTLLIIVFAIVFILFAYQENDLSLYILSGVISVVSILELIRRIFMLSIK